MKHEIRREMMAKRKALSPSLKKTYDQWIVHQIKNDKKFMDAQVIAFYIPMAHEIDISDVYTPDKTFLIPRVDGDDMVFVIYHPDMHLTKTKFGTYEPSKSLKPYQEKIDYMITPALAISKTNDRIGYGKGYYDRYIKKYRPSYVMGIIYPFQEISFKSDHHDEKLDGYIKGEL